VHGGLFRTIGFRGRVGADVVVGSRSGLVSTRFVSLPYFGPSLFILTTGGQVGTIARSLCSPF